MRDRGGGLSAYGLIPSAWRVLFFVACFLLLLAPRGVTAGSSDCAAGSHTRAGWPVVDVLDGDTIVLAQTRYKTFPVRIYGVDAPERGNPRANLAPQPFSGAATRFTRELLLNRYVCLEIKGSDAFGRTLAKVVIGDRSVGHALVRNGLAWWAYEIVPRDAELERLHHAAREKRLGVWADTNAIPPWRWRSTLSPQ